MDVKQAVSTAKNYLTELYADEQMTDLGLEEVQFDEQSGNWLVTLGFSRPWEKAGGFVAVTQTPQQRRSYKVVRVVDKSGFVKSVTSR